MNFVHTHKQTNKQTHTQTNSHTYTSKQNKHTHTNKHTHAHTHTCTHARTHAHTYTHTHARTLARCCVSTGVYRDQRLYVERLASPPAEDRRTTESVLCVCVCVSSPPLLPLFLSSPFSLCECILVPGQALHVSHAEHTAAPCM